jgi:hypothetical protein
MDASPIIAELERADYPSRLFPGSPRGENHAIYFLPGGDLHLATQISDNAHPVILTTPFFAASTLPVEKRISVWERRFKEQ